MFLFNFVPGSVLIVSLILSPLPYNNLNSVSQSHLCISEITPLATYTSWFFWSSVRSTCFLPFCSTVASWNGFPFPCHLCFFKSTFPHLLLNVHFSIGLPSTCLCLGSPQPHRNTWGKSCVSACCSNMKHTESSTTRTSGTLY